MQQTVALDLEQAGVDFLENQRQTSLTGLAFQTKFAFGIDEAGQLADQCVDITDETAQFVLLVAPRYTQAHAGAQFQRSEEHTSERQSIMRYSYPVFGYTNKTT